MYPKLYIQAANLAVHGASTARDVAGITTPELFMQIQTGYKLITYEEPIVMEVIRGHSSCTREGQRS